MLTSHPAIQGIVKTRTRVLLAIAGVAIAAFGGVLLRGVVRELRGGEEWSQLAGVAAGAVTLIVGATHCLYVALTGRLRGRVNRWLSATWQSLTRSLP
jgi:drug/metabolite transporter (DMT)-like permease